MPDLRHVSTAVMLSLALAACGPKPAGDAPQNDPRPSPSPASIASTTKPVWITLGTNSGPNPSAERSQPANLLLVPGARPILVDGGDGASVQLSKAGVPLAQLNTLILSHLHFDHTAGVFAIIAERFQMGVPGKLTIYGPPGTGEFVDGIVKTIPSAPPAGPTSSVTARDMVHVVEVNDASSFAIGPIKITAASNSHYSVTPDGKLYVSLSYRFDVPGRSIVYTGDTGPSANVEKLARGADLLVSGIIDPDMVAGRHAIRPDLPVSAQAQMRAHFEKELLLPAEVGLLANRAGVKAIVLTHNPVKPKDVQKLRPAIAAQYLGPISFANDGDQF